MSKYCKTIRSEYPTVLHSMHSRDIHFLLFYIIWTLRTTPIQNVSVLFIAALYTVPTLFSNIKFLILSYINIQ